MLLRITGAAFTFALAAITQGHGGAATTTTSTATRAGLTPAPPTAQCRGHLVKTDQYPTNKCFIMNDVNVILVCDENTVTSKLFLSSNCSGPAVRKTAIPTGTCQPDSTSRGGLAVYQCLGATVSFAHYSIAPSGPPTGLSCTESRAKAGELSVAVEVNSSEVDEVAFVVGVGSDDLFMAHTVPVGNDHIQETIPGLLPGNEYTVKARVHKRGENEGNPATWSVMTTDIKCKSPSGNYDEPVEKKAVASPIGAAKAPALPRGAAKATRWIEVWRNAADLDYLDQHNSFDPIGMASGVGLFAMGGKGVFLSRYCVEIADVTLKGTTTDTVEAKPHASHFSDYQSCNQGVCRPTGLVDNTWTRRPKDTIFEHCHATCIDNITNLDDSCNASESSREMSRKHVGRATMPIPVLVEFDISKLKQFPSDYPNPTLTSPMAYIFHFPQESHCKPGKHVGDDGCTWQIAPSAHILRMTSAELADNFDLTYHGNGSSRLVIPAHASLNNIESFKKVLANKTLMPVGLPECGASPGRTRALPPQPTFV